MLEPIWNKDHIDHVQITNTEMLGVGDRTQFYDATGALRDMIQSHVLQTLALTTMELPKDLSPDAVRAEKIKVLEENIAELRQMAQDALEDAVLMGGDERQLRAVLHELVDASLILG